jgi:hypothetical protein
MKPTNIEFIMWSVDDTIKLSSGKYRKFRAVYSHVDG